MHPGAISIGRASEALLKAAAEVTCILKSTGRGNFLYWQMAFGWVLQGSPGQLQSSLADILPVLDTTHLKKPMNPSVRRTQRTRHGSDGQVAVGNMGIQVTRYRLPAFDGPSFGGGLLFQCLAGVNGCQ